jgi:hypothetical protein
MGLLNSLRRSVAGCCFVIALAPWGAYAQPAMPSQTPGTTLETAILLPKIADEFHGVVAEHAYIAAHFPDWHIEYQTRIEQNDRHYDQIGMIKPDRTKVPIFFDITEWVGK